MLPSNSEPLASDLLTSFSSCAFAPPVASKSVIGLPSHTTGLSTGERRRTKYVIRVEAYGAIDEANSVIGLARVATTIDPDFARLDAMLLCVQNDLFDFCTYLCMPESDAKPDPEAKFVVPSQVDRLERNINELSVRLVPLVSFVLPGGSLAATALHLARAVICRAERILVALSNEPGKTIDETALKYINRLSDFLFVAARHVNRNGESDILWVPRQNQKSSSAGSRLP